MLPIISYVLSLTGTTIFNVSPTMTDNELKTYIVELTSPQGKYFSQPQDRDEWYKSLLSESASISNEKPIMVHMYHHVMTRFAAKMSEYQAKVMKNMKGVFVCKTCERFWTDSNYGKGIIIGVIDSGITPRHPSFNDEGTPPPPFKWKGKCEVAGCNNKLIGLRNFHPFSKTPVDENGQGTHTSSTAAGSHVHNANVFGNANGTAIGMAPLAHVAMYKVCSSGCSGSAIAAGMDAAIKDGVDVLSLSLGGASIPFYDDVIATSCHAKRDLRELFIGASTIDRRIRTTVYLGNKMLFDGEAINQPKDFDHKLRPLVYHANDTNPATYCLNGSLDHIDVKGKVVLCDEGYSFGLDKSIVVKAAEGAAMILANHKIDGETTVIEPNVIPASIVGYAEGVQIKNYLNSTTSPIATILFRGTIVGIDTTPEVASFSSRGPNLESPGILKPDIIGPGVNILASWPISIDNNTKAKATFNVIAGTSMSCPHLAGIATLQKSEHPDWSPTAIKSAMMTIASQVNLKGLAIVNQKDARFLHANVFTIGAGHINPSKSNDPGLVFDIQPNDYIPYLCGLGYTPIQIEMITKKKVSCSKTIPEAQLNYPSFVVSLKKCDTKTYSRTVTNVGMANSTYTIGEISIPLGVKAKVASFSQELMFTAVHHKLTYNITFTRDSTVEVMGHYGQGHMTWVSSKYSVRTLFAFKFE
ncbi:hypothetical protein Lser_V15G30658 [Lactuca serriola]